MNMYLSSKQESINTLKKETIVMKEGKSERDSFPYQIALMIPRVGKDNKIKT